MTVPTLTCQHRRFRNKNNNLLLRNSYILEEVREPLAAEPAGDDTPLRVVDNGLWQCSNAVVLHHVSLPAVAFAVGVRLQVDKP